MRVQLLLSSVFFMFFISSCATTEISNSGETRVSKGAAVQQPTDPISPAPKYAPTLFDPLKWKLVRNPKVGPNTTGNAELIDQNTDDIMAIEEKLDNLSSEFMRQSPDIDSLRSDFECLKAMVGLELIENKGAYFVRKRTDSKVYDELKRKCFPKL